MGIIQYLYGDTGIYIYGYTGYVYYIVVYMFCPLKINLRSIRYEDADYGPELEKIFTFLTGI